MTVELLAPQLRVHLKLDVFEVDLAVDGFHVLFGDVVVALFSPVLLLAEVAQLFPTKKSTRFYLKRFQRKRNRINEDE